MKLHSHFITYAPSIVFGMFFASCISHGFRCGMLFSISVVRCLCRRRCNWCRSACTQCDCKIVHATCGHWSRVEICWQADRRLLFLLHFSPCCRYIWHFFPFSGAKLLWTIFKIYPCWLSHSSWIWMRRWVRPLVSFVLFCSLFEFYWPYLKGFLGTFYGHSAVLFPVDAVLVFVVMWMKRSVRRNTFYHQIIIA